MRHSEPCILIVYSTFGDGHLQAAKAIRQSFISRGVENVHLVDLWDEAHPHWNAISRFTYLKSSTYFPGVYGFSYRLSNPAKPNPLWSRFFNSMGKRKLKEIVRRLRPDAVIHTFPYLAMLELKGQPDFNIPAFTVLTDYVLHSRWIHPDTQRYFVATERLKESLIHSGMKAKQITVSGIPIRKAFEKEIDRDSVRRKYGLEPGKNYVMVSAGAYGVLTDIRTMVDEILANTEFDVLIGCGKNRSLYEKLNACYGLQPRIRLMGFVEQMEELMAVSACLLTKAGAITLTEALALRVPTIVYRPLPGQERGNAEFLSDQGAIFVARSLGELTNKLHLLESESSRQKMRSSAKNVYRAGAAETIVSEVLQEVKLTKQRSMTS